MHDFIVNFFEALLALFFTLVIVMLIAPIKSSKALMGIILILWPLIFLLLNYFN